MPKARVSHWRTTSRQVIGKVIQDNPHADRDLLLKMISAAYPFGERRYWPYKIWLDEVHYMTGQPKPAPIPPGQLNFIEASS